LPEKVDILIANLPYVKSAIAPPARNPIWRWDGGMEGLDVIERLCDGLKGKLKPDGCVYCWKSVWGRRKRLKDAAIRLA
jgi:methylase of polypeptide subunit release factors